jgi:RNA polymerase sigma factor (TIGR02999 family)
MGFFMASQQGHDVTRILSELKDGDESATQRLMPLVYEELRALAGSFFLAQQVGHTLQPTALVHEAYLRMVGAPDAKWTDRKHFFRVAARAMRQLLIDHARRRRAARRGGDTPTVTLDSSFADQQSSDIDLVALDEVLTKLTLLDERQGRIVELRFLAGLTVEETADVLDLSPRTVELDSRLARAWLRRELGEGV